MCIPTEVRSFYCEAKCELCALEKPQFLKLKTHRIWIAPRKQSYTFFFWVLSLILRYQTCVKCAVFEPTLLITGRQRTVNPGYTGGSRLIWIWTIWNPGLFKSYENHTPISPMLICPLNSNLVNFKEFYLVLLFGFTRTHLYIDSVWEGQAHPTRIGIHPDLGWWFLCNAKKKPKKLKKLCIFTEISW